MTNATPADRLLAEAEWARALARRLVADAATADDVVQEAWIAAMRSPPDDDRPVRPWLAAVLQNAARQLRRGDVRRRTHEHRAEARGTAPSAAEVVEKAEAQRALVDAVLALPEPERHSVLLRYFEGLSAADIARHSGVPAPTVRWRLQKGLARLRETLDARFGDPRSWALALLPLARPPVLPPPGLPSSTIPAAGATPAALMLGGALVSKKVLAWSAALAVVAFGAFAGLGPDNPASSPSSNRTPASQVVTTDAPSAHHASNAVDSETLRSTVDSSAANLAATVIGRCVDANGEPVPDARLALTAKAFDAKAFERGQGPWSETCSTTTSDATGRFALRAPAESIPSDEGIRRWFEVRAGHDDFLETAGSLDGLRVGETVDLGDVELRRGARLRARVTDPEGRALAGVAVRVETGIARFDRRESRTLRAARSGPDGSLEFPGDPMWLAGKWQIHVEDDFELKAPIELLIPEGVDVVTSTLVIRPRGADEAISGRILDPDGRPIAGARVEAVGHPLPLREVETSADGTFTIWRSGETGPRVVLRVLGSDDHAPLRTEPVSFGSHGLDLVLERAHRLDLSVTSDDGTPLEKFGVLVAWSGDDSRHSEITHRGDHAGGRLSIGGLGPSGHVMLLVCPEDGEHGLPKPMRIPMAASGATTVNVVVPRLLPLDIRVLDPEGRAVAGSTVEVVQLPARSQEDPRRALARAFSRDVVVGIFGPSFDDWPLPFVLEAAETNAAGQTRIRVPRRGDGLGLRVLGERHAALLVAPFVMPAPDETLELTVELAGRVTGVAEPAGAGDRFRIGQAKGHGTHPIGLVLRNVNTGELHEPSPWNAWPIAADGTFAIDSVPAGRYAVCFHWWRPSGLHQATAELVEPPLRTIEVRAGETTRVELDLTPLLPVVLRGRVVHDGRPLAHATVRITSLRTGAGGEELVDSGLGDLETDGEGRFAFGGMPPGEYHLLARSHDSAAWLPATAHLHLAPGADVEHTFVVEACRVRIRLVDPDGAPVASRPVTVLQPRDRRAWTTASDAEGHVTVADAAPGELRILVHAVDASPDRAAGWSEAARRTGATPEPVLVPAGQAAIETTRVVR